MRDAVFVVLFLSVIPAALLFLHSAVMLWIWTALAEPTFYLYGFAKQIPVNKLAVALTLMAVIVDRTRRRPLFDMHIWLLLLFTLHGAISYSFRLSDLPGSFLSLDKMIKITALCIIMTMCAWDKIKVHALVVVVGLAAGIHSALEGLKYIVSVGGHKVDVTAFGDNNYLALAALMNVPILLYAYRRSQSKVARTGFLGLLVASLIGVVATASRGGLIGLVFLGAFAFLQSRRKIFSLILIFIVSILLINFTPERWRDRMNTIGSADSDSSFMSRVSSWKLHTILAMDHPFTGGGFSALEDSRVAVIYHAYFDRLSFIDSPRLEGPLAAHSIYFQVLGDLGFVGFFLFMAIILTGLVHISVIRARTRSDESLAWCRDFAGLIRLSLILYLVVGAALSANYMEFLYILLTLISILGRITREAKEHGAAQRHRMHGVRRPPAGEPLRSPAPIDTVSPGRGTWRARMQDRPEWRRRTPAPPPDGHA